MKRIMSVLLSLSLTAGLLTGCGSGDPTGGKDQPGKTGDSNVPMGRYVETPMGSLPGVERLRGGYRAENGDIVVYGESRSEGWYKRIVIPPAGEPTMTDVPWLTDLVAAGNSVPGVADGPDGLVYAIYREPQGAVHLVSSADGTTVKEISIPEWTGWGQGGGAGGSFTVMPDGTVTDSATTPEGSGEAGGAVTSSGFSIDSSGSVTMGGAEPEGGGIEVDAGNAGSFSVGSSGNVAVEGASGAKTPTGLAILDNGDYLVYFGPDGAARYSAADGKRLVNYPGTAFQNTTAVYETKLLITSPDYSTMWLYDLDTGKQTECAFDNMDFATVPGLDAEGLLLTTSGGIFRQAEGGSLWEKLVDGELTSLSIPNMTPEMTISDSDGGFCVFLSTNDGVEVMRYTYSADTPTNPDTELTIAGLSDSSTIRQTIGEFQRRNSNVKVNYQVLLEEDSAATAEDVIRALNTELLAGRGPDLLVLDGLPVDSYIEKGVLADLTDQLRALVDDGLLENMTRAFEREGKRYGIPARFTVPVMMGKKEDVARVLSLEDLAAMVEAGQGGDPQFLWPSESLYEDGGMLMEYYNACAGDMVGRSGLDESGLTGYLSQMLRIQNAERNYTPELGEGVMASIMVSSGGSGGFELLDSGAMKLGKGEALFHVQDLIGQMGLQMILSNLDDGSWALDSLFGGNSYSPVSSVGIVANTKQRELADAFAGMLVSATVQDNYLYDGFPVNGTSLDKMVNEVMDETAGGDMGFRALCDKLDTPILIDQVVREAVEAQAKALAEGNVTPEQAAANVVDKTKIYLAE